ncbi:hypothetical protein ACQI4F_20555 [Mycolicibacterium vaccae]|uniref:hypothetical protein n=1 Tax=Mycolicibacterium vaccae TaxID=1810 RepID=UPI003CEE77B4
MSESGFVDNVSEIVGPVLTRRGFVIDEVDDHVDEGGRTGEVVYFRGPDCRLQVYWSAREREINAMLAPLDAPNEHGLYNRSGKWHYLNSFVPRPQIPLEELVRQRKAERENFETETKWLQWLAHRIDTYYESAHAGIRNLHE